MRTHDLDTLSVSLLEPSPAPPPHLCILASRHPFEHPETNGSGLSFEGTEGEEGVARMNEIGPMVTRNEHAAMTRQMPGKGDEADAPRD